MRSKITGGPTQFLFTAKVLGKYDVKYYQCKQTGFIQTEDPYWLDEAYSSAIATLDLGLMMRNQNMCKDVERIISRDFKADGRFLDYAGGYGIFTRMMRDRGFDFYHTDKYCQNIFSQHFDLSDIEMKAGFDVLTAFEVFEHLVNPLAEIEHLLSYSDNLIFSTEMVPVGIELKPESWWYFVPEIGQHIAFYTEESLQFIAQKFNCNFYTNGSNLHLITKRRVDHNPMFKAKRDKFLVRKLKKLLARLDKQPKARKPLLDADIDYVKSRLTLR
ncbi:MAG: glycosyl transferase group 1 [Sphingobacteriaceae bacterium]|jgi:hypothetical protein|nr:glycosyl transferase group 1 [Sphingobacteriaceae bacterium]